VALLALLQIAAEVDMETAGEDDDDDASHTCSHVQTVVLPCTDRADAEGHRDVLDYVYTRRYPLDVSELLRMVLVADKLQVRCSAGADTHARARPRACSQQCPLKRALAPHHAAPAQAT
jgi:hypothetical protein